MRNTLTDCVYYWQGGTESGRWLRSDASTLAAVRRAGYVAHPGNTDIGPPEGPPRAKEIAAVLAVRS